MPTVFDKLSSFESWFDFSGLKSRHGIEEILSEERQKKLVASLHAILKPFLLRRVKADVEASMPKKREYVLYAAMSELQRELYAAIRNGKGREFLQEKMMSILRRKRDLKAKKQLGGAATKLHGNSASKKQQSKKRKSLLDYGYLTPNKSARTSRDSTPGSQASFSTSASAKKRRAAMKRRNYEDISDAQYFRRLEDGLENPDSPSYRSGFGSDGEHSASSALAEEKEEEEEEEAMLAIAKRHLQAKKLQNPLMQLRLCCNSPYNFFTPWDVCADDDDVNADDSKISNKNTNGDDDDDNVAALMLPDESLVQTSGKMMILDELLPALFAGGHKVLIFSQFKTQLDLIETYARELRGWPLCRIDGATPQEERHAMIRAFNEKIPNDDDDGKSETENNSSNNKAKRTKSRSKTSSSLSSPSSSSDTEPPPSLFLLTTRAGGQGINLAAADTVILFDSDWNPAQDAQAQDRAHRIGQTRNVIVYRLATRGTVEQLVLESAGAKARLERLVVRKGGLVRGSAGAGAGAGAKSGSGKVGAGAGAGAERGRDRGKRGGSGANGSITKGDDLVDGLGNNGIDNDNYKEEEDEDDEDDEFKDLQRALGSVEGEMFDASASNNDTVDADEYGAGASSDIPASTRSTRATKSHASTAARETNGNKFTANAKTATPTPTPTPRVNQKSKPKPKPIFSPQDLALLTDRSDEAYMRTEAGLHNRLHGRDGRRSGGGGGGDGSGGDGKGTAMFRAVEGSLEKKGGGGTEGLLGLGA